MSNKKTAAHVAAIFSLIRRGPEHSYPLRPLGALEWKVLSIIDALLNKLLELLDSLRSGEDGLQTAKDPVGPTEDAPKKRHQPATGSGLWHLRHLRHWC